MCGAPFRGGTRRSDPRRHSVAASVQMVLPTSRNHSPLGVLSGPVLSGPVWSGSWLPTLEPSQCRIQTARTGHASSSSVRCAGRARLPARRADALLGAATGGMKTFARSIVDRFVSAGGGEWIGSEEERERAKRVRVGGPRSGTGNAADEGGTGVQLIRIGASRIEFHPSSGIDPLRQWTSTA